MNEVPETSEAMTVTSCKSFSGPFFSVRVTGPSAFIQVMVNGLPSSTVNSVLVSLGCARAAAAKAITVATENFMVMIMWA